VVALRAEHPIKQALEWQKMMEADSVLNQAKIAENEGVSRARVCQLMRLLSLAPEIQRVLVDTHDPASIRLLNERKTREIAALPDRQSQLKAFMELRQTLRSAAIP
jgi:ParB-like chromosome segregation protein Spo0J